MMHICPENTLKKEATSQKQDLKVYFEMVEIKQDKNSSYCEMEPSKRNVE